MLPALERAIYERTGERVPRDAWDLRALPAYLALSFRVVDEHDKILAQGRDLAELQRTLGQRAKELWAARAARAARAHGLKTWDFDALPPSVTLDVGGRTLLAYPALVDTETAVDVRLLESPAAAAAATRDGLRRLFLLQLGTTLAKLEAQLPGALAAATKRQVVLRALDEAFRLDEPETFPRSKAAFAERLADGPRRSCRACSRELEPHRGRARAPSSTRCAPLLKALAGKPGPLRAADRRHPEPARATSSRRI